MEDRRRGPRRLDPRRPRAAGYVLLGPRTADLRWPALGLPTWCSLTDPIVVAALMLSLVPMAAGAQRAARCGTPSEPPCTVRGMVFTTVSAGRAHTCAVAVGGVGYCWGDATRGALGDGSRRVSRLPVRVAGATIWADIGSGADYSCGLAQSGEVLCWGDSQAVPGWPRTASSPVPVRLTVRAERLSVGRRHACILDSAGQAWCWGWNVDGETGSGKAGIAAAMVADPLPVEGDHRFESIAAGFGFTSAADRDGATWCWGSNVEASSGRVRRRPAVRWLRWAVRPLRCALMFRRDHHVCRPERDTHAVSSGGSRP